MTTFHTYIGECCREWPMAAGFPVGRCGLCGESPTYKREDDECSCPYCKRRRNSECPARTETH